VLKVPATFWSGLWTIAGALIFVGAVFAFSTARFGLGIALVVATLVCLSGSWRAQHLAKKRARGARRG
jgi:uncharacterized membrane protein (GlpM family)